MNRAPVIAAWGAGVDSTAMIVELAERGEPIDMVLFADPGSEKSRTYAYIPIFRRWMADRGIPSEIVRYQPRNFKHWPPYATIAENMLTNATLPSVVFNRGSCSQKWKASAQDAWTAEWEPARRCWDAGDRVVKLIGYDASPRDTQRYHHAVGCEDPLPSMHALRWGAGSTTSTAAPTPSDRRQLMRNAIIKSFTVEGNGEFPLDMLRSDRCWPAGADDAARIGAHYGMADPDRARARSITLETAEKYTPNRQRWLSFRWRVVD